MVHMKLEITKLVAMKLDITKLVADGLYKEALGLFSQINSASLRPHKFAYPYLLKACAKLEAFARSQELHAHIIKTGFVADIYTATALTDMYMKLQSSHNAVKAFDEIPEPNINTLNVTISGLFKNGFHNEAMEVFGLVGSQHVRPNSVTVVSLLSECDSPKYGFQVHCLALKLGVQADIYVSTSLVTMYSKFGELASASKVFEQVQRKNVTCYNAFISGLLQNGSPHAVLLVFKGINDSSDEKPNDVTFMSTLSACSQIKYVRFGMQIHCHILKIQNSFDIKVGTALVDMYSKSGFWQFGYDAFKELNANRSIITWNTVIAGMMSSGQIEIAIEFFAQLQSEGLQPDSATWNSMIHGFSQQGKEAEAFLFFKKMLDSGVRPSLKSITSLLPACSSMSSLKCGKEIHAHIVRNAMSSDEFIATSLVDMYMKCGRPSLARLIFDSCVVKNNDPTIWNAMISGYGKNGDNKSATEIFDQMLQEGVRPNSATFNCILSVCSHSGDIEKGLDIFRRLNVDYGLNPTSNNFSCLVDLMGRSGRLVEARKLLEEIDKPSASDFASLLGACKCYSDSDLGEEMAKKLSEMEPENPTPFVILSSIYADQGKWKDVERVRDIINQRGLKKFPGYSLIEVK